MKKVLKNIQCIIHPPRMRKKISVAIAKRGVVQKMRIWIILIHIQSKVLRKTMRFIRWKIKIMDLCSWRTGKTVGGSTCLVILRLT